MVYNFYNAYRTISKSPSEGYRDASQRLIDSQFKNSASYYLIEEETGIGTGVYENLGARITHVINPKTSESQGDDYRNIIFSEITKQRVLGSRYRFDNNIWLAVNSDYYKYTTQNVIVRRANETLRYYNDDGILIEEPCVVNQGQGIVPFNEDRYMRLPDGSMKCYVQKNDNTLNLEEGAQFILGDGKNLEKYELSYDNNYEFSGILKFSLTRYQINDEVDNLSLKIANYSNRPIFSISSSVPTTQISVGNTTQITATLLDRDGQVSDKPLSYSSSDESIATVSDSGLVTATGNGVVNITVSMTNNSSVTSVINMTVTATPVVERTYQLSDNTSTLFRTEDIEVSVQGFNGGSPFSESYAFEINSSSTADSKTYTFEVVDGDIYRIVNKGDSSGSFRNLIVDITPQSNVGDKFSKTYELRNGYS